MRTREPLANLLDRFVHAVGVQNNAGRSARELVAAVRAADEEREKTLRLFMHAKAFLRNFEEGHTLDIGGLRRAVNDLEEE